MVADIAKPPTADKSRENRLLLCCARNHIDSIRAEQIKTLLHENLDWDYLLQTAFSHKVTPLLYCSLNSTCPEAVPQARLAQLRDYFHSNARRNLFLTGELLKILNLFSTHRIPAIAFKGPVLAASVYGQLVLRQFCDLDIMICEQDTIKTKKLLSSQGYQLGLQLNWQYHFVHKDSRVNLDIHYAGLTPRERPLSLHFQHLWSRVKPVSVSGTPVLTFQPEDLLLILCVQVAKDCWQWREQLAKICDVAEAIRVHPKIDWHQVIQQARSTGSERMLFLGLLLAHELLGTSLPDQVWQRMQAHPIVNILCQQVCERLFTMEQSATAHRLPKYRDTEKNLFYFRVRERLRDKVPYFLYLAKALLSPTVEDYESLPLPASLYFLYYLTRPFRLARKCRLFQQG